MEKMHRERRTSTNPEDIIIDGLPPLRGMFISPEFSTDNLIPSVTEFMPADRKTEEHERSYSTRSQALHKDKD
jgi:hypothetical protein